MCLARIATIAAALTLAAGAVAQAQTPKRGGTITLPITGDAPNLDCHATATLPLLAFTAPHYSMLVRYDQNNYPNIKGDLAESWTVSPDGLTYTFKLRPNVKFHDGSTLTVDDVKTTYERIRNPPQGVTSARRAEFTDVTAIETPDAQTIVFRLGQRNAAFLATMAAPYTCIYSAKKLAADPNYPANVVMGTGPFTAAEYQRGQSWSGKRFDGYYQPGKPYLDGFKLVIMAPQAMVNSLAAGQLDGSFRGYEPQEIETMRAGRGDKIRFLTVATDVATVATINLQRKPFDDARVRRALTLAIDRQGGIENLRKITNQASWGGTMRPGHDMGLPEAELVKLPGFGTDMAARRAEARRLLAEAGQSNLTFKLLNRTQSTPWLPLGVYVIDQWRQIGLNIEMQAIEQPAQYLKMEADGDFDISIDANPAQSSDPSLMLIKYLPGAGVNYGKIADPLLTDLYAKQKAAPDAASRRALVNDFERRVLSEAYSLPLFWAGTTAPLASDVHGWVPTPNFFVGYDMTDVWRD